jgi:NAD+ diphosphatase
MRPTLVFTGGSLDRASARRTDSAWLAARRSDGMARVVPVWRNLSLVIEAEGTARPVLAEGDAAVTLLATAATVVFLGLDGQGHAVFAAVLADTADGMALGGALAPAASFADLSKLAPRLGAADGALLAYARALAHWHGRHRHCGVCGAATVSDEGGHVRRCSEAACGATWFPHTDPVVIMLVTHGDRCLLARQAKWLPGLYSTLAGFVEPGEALEDAVIREIREETGAAVTAVRYVASQPWPFPQSLMLAFRAEAETAEEPAFDRGELEDARWFTAREIPELRARGIRLPYRGTIARALIEDWLAEVSPGEAPALVSDAAAGR